MKKIFYFFIVIVAMIFVSLFAIAQTPDDTCALGRNETELSIQRVMLNYGKYFRLAENVLDKHKNNIQLTQKDFDDAVIGLSKALTCTQLVADQPTNEKTLPSFLFRLNEDEKNKTIKTYLYYMENFKEQITDYQNEIIKLSSTPEDQRDFSMLIILQDTLNKYVEKAHKKTMEFR